MPGLARHGRLGVPRPAPPRPRSAREPASRSSRSAGVARRAGRRRFVAADLTTRRASRGRSAAIAPDVVFHLAGRTPPADAEALYRANTLATLHLLDALPSLGPARAGSCWPARRRSWGRSPVEDLPVGEDYPCRPADAYGLSKWLATGGGPGGAAAAGGRRRPGLQPDRAGHAAEPGVRPVRRAARRGRRPARADRVGDLDARRDFVDVRDVARALIALADRGRAGRVYHVGTGASHRVGDGLDRPDPPERPRRSTSRSTRRSPAGRGRATRGPTSGGSSAETGWRPRIAWEQSLDDLWDEAVARAAAVAIDRPAGPPVSCGPRPTDRAAASRPGPGRVRDDRGRRSLLAIVLLAAALHAVGIARTTLPAQDGLKFIRVARQFQDRPWADVVRGPTSTRSTRP